jgi:hypothetical protein
MATHIDLDEVNVGEVLDWMEKNDCEEFSFSQTRELVENETFYVSKKELLGLSKKDDFTETDFTDNWEGHLDDRVKDCLDNIYSSSLTITKKVENKDEVIKELKERNEVLDTYISDLELKINSMENTITSLRQEVDDLSELRVA